MHEVRWESARSLMRALGLGTSGVDQAIAVAWSAIASTGCFVLSDAGAVAYQARLADGVDWNHARRSVRALLLTYYPHAVVDLDRRAPAKNWHSLARLYRDLGVQWPRSGQPNGWPIVKASGCIQGSAKRVDGSYVMELAPGVTWAHARRVLRALLADAGWGLDS